MRTVRSRVLLGVGAWLLGAAAATAGSLYAVGELGNSLLAVSTKQMSVAMVNSDLAQENARHAVPLPASTRPSSDQSNKVGGKPAHSRTSPGPGHSAGPVASSSAGTLLTSPDGSAEAVCTASGAYLSYWSPQPGFEVDDFARGPAAVASVVFRGTSGGIKMNVSCQGGVPIKRVVNVGWVSGGRHDE